VDDVRVFASRASTGVRGMKLVGDDEVMSMSVLKHAKAEIDKRDAYLKEAAARRRAEGLATEDDKVEMESTTNTTLTAEEFEKMANDEEFILTLTSAGYGKRTSAYEYRITSRGTQGVTNIKTDEGKRAAHVIASMPVNKDDDLMLVTDGGQIIRTRVNDIRIAGRATMGVIVFRLDGKKEKVVSATTVPYMESDEEEIQPTDETVEQVQEPVNEQ
jgi:DNA gyrase subunit A